MERLQIIHEGPAQRVSHVWLHVTFKFVTDQCTTKSHKHDIIPLALMIALNNLNTLLFVSNLFLFKVMSFWTRWPAYCVIVRPFQEFNSMFYFLVCVVRYSCASPWSSNRNDFHVLMTSSIVPVMIIVDSYIYMIGILLRLQFLEEDNSAPGACMSCLNLFLVILMICYIRTHLAQLCCSYLCQ